MPLGDVVRRHKNGARTNVLGTTVYGTRQSTSLPRQMKFHVHIQQLFEGFSSDFADSTLPDVSKDSIK